MFQRLAAIGVLCSTLACGVPLEQHRAQLAANRALRAELDRERALRAALEQQAVALRAQLDLLSDERDQLTQELEADAVLLADADATRERLAELNAELAERRRELSRLNDLTRQSERMSDSWYNAALERARRGVSGAP